MTRKMNYWPNNPEGFGAWNAPYDFNASFEFPPFIFITEPAAIPQTGLTTPHDHQANFLFHAKSEINS